MEWVNTERWVDVGSTKHNFTDEQMAELNKSEKVFDYFADFDAYFPDFFKIGIDLTESDIDWFKFNWLLSSFMEDGESMIAKRMMARGYNPTKGESKEYKMYMNKKKRIYSLTPLRNEWEKLSEIGGKNG